MSIEPTPELLQKIADRKALIEQAREGMRLKIKYSSRSLGGHTTEYRKLCRLAGIPVIKSVCKPVSDTPKITIGKPCRYKACKGRNHALHGEKCPVASARGKTGGTSGTGEVKQRLGDTNGKFKRVRACGCPVRQHRPDCHLARPSSKIVLRETNVEIRKVLNIKPVEWRSKALSVGAVSQYLRGVDGICSACNKSLPAVTASKVHKDDVMSNPVRVICRGCEQ